MKIFVCGDQEEEYIINTIDYIHESFKVDHICGSASSPCMDVILPWAERKNIKTSIYLPTSVGIIVDSLKLNSTIIQKEKPHIILIYSEHEVIVNQLIREANQSQSVQYVIRKVE